MLPLRSFMGGSATGKQVQGSALRPLPPFTARPSPLSLSVAWRCAPRPAAASPSHPPRPPRAAARWWESSATGPTASGKSSSVLRYASLSSSVSGTPPAGGCRRCRGRPGFCLRLRSCRRGCSAAHRRRCRRRPRPSGQRTRARRTAAAAETEACPSSAEEGGGGSMEAASIWSERRQYRPSNVS